jgi:hypothetical protein
LDSQYNRCKIFKEDASPARLLPVNFKLKVRYQNETVFDLSADRPAGLAGISHYVCDTQGTQGFPK